MTTIRELVTHTGIPVHDYLDHDADIPRVHRAAAQGDVLVLRVTTTAATTPMPHTVMVVASEASSNTHTLHPAGPAFWDAHAGRANGDVLLGILTVPAGSTALLSHQEHGGLEIEPGTYEIRRQREYAGEWRMAAD